MSHSDPEAIILRRLPDGSTKQPPDQEQSVGEAVLSKELHKEGSGFYTDRSERQWEQASSITADKQIFQQTGRARPRRKKSRWKQGIRGILRKRVPILQQMTTIECGATCLAMILSYYGRPTGVLEVRERCGLSRDGLSSFAIVKAARSFGLRTRALSLKKVNDLRFVKLPAIVHWDFNHFLVVERWSRRYLDVVDPATGRRRVNTEEFENRFTGVILLLEPGVNFDTSNPKTRLSGRVYAVHYVKQAPKAFLQIVGASLLLQIIGLATPILTVLAINTIIPAALHDLLSLLGIEIIIVLCAQLVISLLREVLLLYVQTRIDMHMMLQFVERLFKLPLLFFQQRSSGDILARMNSNLVIRDLISNQLISTVLDGSFVTIYFVLLFIQSPWFSLLVLGIGLVQLAILLGTSHLVHRLSSQELMAQGQAQGYMAELLAGMATLKAMGAEHQALDRWSNLFFEQLNSSVKRNFVAALMNTAMLTIRTGAPLTLLWFGTWQVINGQLSVGTMLALNALAVTFLTPLATLINNSRSLQLIQAHLERITDVLEAKQEQEPGQLLLPPRLTGKVHLEGVSFQYAPDSAPVLRNISVTIEAGQKIAIVGRTGSGKSTLGNLLLGLYLPTQGEIFYDDLPLKKLDYQAVRSHFGVVTQNTNLFSGTIRENITLSNPGANMESIVHAARIVALHEDVMSMPMRYETYLSEDGNTLSGGQRQRLALARALVTTPALLLLDEATSALDVVTETIIDHNLRGIPCTQIIIAHRLSTIRNADLILVLDQGQIVERGTHYELLGFDGYYKQLIESQLTDGGEKR